MNVNGTPISCGVMTIDHINTDMDEALEEFLRACRRVEETPAFVLWSNIEVTRSGTSVDSKGHQFQRFVDGRFGTVLKTDPAVNANTMNHIVVWAWSPNWESLSNWYQERKNKRSIGSEK